MKERVRKSFSAIARNYGKRAELQRKAGKEVLRRLRLIGSPLPLLDLGCGDGSLTPERAIGLDIAPAMVRELKEKGKAGICGDGEEIPFRSSSFRCVISNFALQWTELKRSLREVHRVLKEGGYFIASIPVEGSLKTLFECWRRTGSSLPLFKFPQEEEVFSHLKEKFEVMEFERMELKKNFKDPRKALKAVTGVGAKNPYGRGRRREVLKFLELYGERPVVEYRLLLFTARKA